MSREATVRINLEVPASVRSQLRTLQETTGAASQAETFRKAINLYEFLMATNASEAKIIVERKSGEREVIHFI